MVGPLEDKPLQDNLIAIGRQALLAAHARLLKARNAPNWEVAHKAKHQEIEAAKIIGLRISDSTYDDYLAEGVIIETMIEDAAKCGLRVLHRDEMVKPDLREKKPGQHIIGVLGEEYMKVENNPDWKGLGSLVPDCDIIALVDPLDGTVLRQRDLPNWCIAIVFYTRNEGEVLASLIVQAVGDLYFATRCTGAFKQNLNHVRPIEDGRLNLGGAKAVNAEPVLPERHLAFVAQNPKAFIRMAERKTILEGFDRVYNLGGNPMLAKLADGSMSAVIELGGHKAHDVVPGAFIAKMAGAVVNDLKGQELDWRSALRNPDHKEKAGLLSYVAAVTAEVADQIRKDLG